MTELQWTEVDGVATVWVEAPAPLRVALLFRTGRADEDLFSSGHTHLIEHIAMSCVIDPARNNGFVGEVFTGFEMMGSPEEVCAFLLDICTALGSMPSERLVAEKQVLVAEGATRPYDVRANLLTMRFGATGYGLIGLPELGIHGATVDQLDHLRLQRFTSGNAILWLSGPPPVGLRLELPPGRKHPLPPLTPIQRRFPSWYIDDMCGGIAAGATVPRVPASTLYCAIAAKRLRSILRVERALSYAPTISYMPLDANTAHLVLHADSEPARRAKLADAFGEVLDVLKEFDEPEVAAAQREAHEQLMGSFIPWQAQQLLLNVNRAAVDWLFGREFEPIELLQAQILSVTPRDLAAFGREVHQTLILARPGTSRVRSWMGESMPASTVPVVQGRGIPSIDAPVRRERLVHGPDGVSVLWPNGSHTTVRHSELAAAVSYDDGCVCLVGRDAATVTVEPTLWPDGQNVCREIRECVPAYLLLDHGSRPASTIPKPLPHHRSEASRRFLWFGLVVLTFLIVLLAFVVFILLPSL